jgi:competence protein ComEA
MTIRIMRKHRIVNNYNLFVVIGIMFCISCSGGGQKAAGDHPMNYAGANRSPMTASRVNINTASAAELEILPDIGPQLAQQIIEFRSKYGKFRRIEHLMLIDGISEKRFRAISAHITAE